MRLTPGARADAIEGWGADDQGRPYLIARVRARPVEGEANAALVALLAEVLHIRRTAIVVAHGTSSRLKQISIEGLDEAAVLARLPAR